MTLTGSKVDYSEHERALFAAVSEHRGPVSTSDLIHLSRGFHKRQSILASLSTLGRKIEVNKERFRLRRSKQRGPHPIEWWLEKRK